MFRLAATLALVFHILLPQSAFAWGPDGHRLVGSIADQLLNPRAKQHVRTLLGVDLSEAGPWLDCVKSVHRQTDGSLTYVVDSRYEPPCTPFANDRAAMVDCASRELDRLRLPGRSKCHREFRLHDTGTHFDDIAVQRDRFDRNYAGTNDHDLVAAINAAIAVLLDRPAPPPFDIKNKKEALFMLAHLVGDLAQPLHVAAPFVGPDGSLVDPDVTHTIDPNTETAGGNSNSRCKPGIPSRVGRYAVGPGRHRAADIGRRREAGAGRRRSHRKLVRHLGHRHRPAGGQGRHGGHVASRRLAPESGRSRSPIGPPTSARRTASRDNSSPRPVPAWRRS